PGPEGADSRRRDGIRAGAVGSADAGDSGVTVTAEIQSEKRAERKHIPPPMALLAELTHRCPLACPYCSNPLQLTGIREELSTEDWISIFRQAADLGVLHLHLSGGEPAARRDLV